jgi:hypothetical protein
MVSRKARLWAIAKGLLFAACSLILLGMVPFGAIGMFIAAFASVFVVPIFGISAFLGLQWFGRTSLRAYLWTGFGISTVLAFALAIRLPHTSGRMLVALYEIAYILIGGPLAAWAFWRTVRPDLPATDLVPDRPEMRSGPAAPALK